VSARCIHFLVDAIVVVGDGILLVCWLLGLSVQRTKQAAGVAVVCDQLVLIEVDQTLLGVDGRGHTYGSV